MSNLTARDRGEDPTLNEQIPKMYQRLPHTCTHTLIENKERAHKRHSPTDSYTWTH